MKFSAGPSDDLRQQLEKNLHGVYSFERELGGGAMSRVFVAEELALRRKVVLKALPNEQGSGLSAERFKREILVAARLQHPHIVPLLAAGESGSTPWFTMPFVDGETLGNRLSREGHLSITEGVRIVRQVASALANAHEKGIVHRDIKPENILLSGDSALVTDFGVAKAISESVRGNEQSLTGFGLALGTPAYMSPEQVTASPVVDARTDIYSLGATAYEIFAGKKPFSYMSAQKVMAAHVTEVPADILSLRVLPPALGALVMRCLEKDPADRPQAADEIVRTLDSISVVESVRRKKRDIVDVINYLVSEKGTSGTSASATAAAQDVDATGVDTSKHPFLVRLLLAFASGLVALAALFLHAPARKIAREVLDLLLKMLN